jgi:SAM-dependent methyltransferase
MNPKFSIVKDPTYGYLRADPIPSLEEVNKYYQDEFYSRVVKFNDSALSVQLEEKAFFDSRWEQIEFFCKDHFGAIEGLSLFDVGFGFAQALLYFKNKGMNVCGLEPSKEAVSYARKQGLEVFQSGFEQLDCVEGRKFNVVLAINVLEHLREPVDLLCKMHDRLLCNNGLLIIDVANEYNDFQVVADREFNLNQWWLCPPNHINYFTITSLTDLLEKNGFKIINRIASFPMELFLLLGQKYIGDDAVGKRCHEMRVQFETLMKKHGKQEKLINFYKVLADLDLGRQAVLCATPI